MATERNPYEMKQEEVANVVPMKAEEEMEATFEVDPTDGGVIVDFSSEEVTMSASEEIAEWYGNLTETLDDEYLDEIADQVIDNFQADKDSRAEWESMFERGFDLLGLKLQPGSDPFDGACTAVHPLLIESAVKFQSKASAELAIQTYIKSFEKFKRKFKLLKGRGADTAKQRDGGIGVVLMLTLFSGAGGGMFSSAACSPAGMMMSMSNTTKNAIWTEAHAHRLMRPSVPTWAQALVSRRLGVNGQAGFKPQSRIPSLVKPSGKSV